MQSPTAAEGVVEGTGVVVRVTEVVGSGEGEDEEEGTKLGETEAVGVDDREMLRDLVGVGVRETEGVVLAEVMALPEIVGEGLRLAEVDRETVDVAVLEALGGREGL